MIETTTFVAAALEPRFGVMHSADFRLTERVEVNRSTQELEITWTIDDPVVSKEPHTQKEIFVRTDVGVSPTTASPATSNSRRRCR